MSEQMTFFPIELPPVLPFKSPYQKWKFENHYRKSDSTEIRCKNCVHKFTKYRQRYYHKCELLGISCCNATDITLSSVCDLFIRKKSDCQLCKHLDCDTEGHFICGLDGDILDHEGIYCNNFEEYEEQEQC